MEHSFVRRRTQDTRRGGQYWAASAVAPALLITIDAAGRRGRHVARITLALGIIIMVSMMYPTSASACQCAYRTPIEECDAASQIVIATVAAKGPSGMMESVTLTDFEVLKGTPIVEPSITIDNGGDCAPAALEQGKRYVLYNFPTRTPASSEHWSFNICHRVVELSGAEPEIRRIKNDCGKPKDPEPASPTAPPPEQTNGSMQRPPERTPGTATRPNSGCAGCTLSAAANSQSSAPVAFIASMMLAVAQLARLRRKRRRRH